MLVGAGPLTSAISKSGSEQSGWRYRFTVSRQPADSNGDPHVFQPEDLVPFVKLIQVLAAEMTADGCLPPTERTALRNLAAQLDDFLGGATVEDDDDAVSTLGNRQPSIRSPQH